VLPQRITENFLAGTIRPMPLICLATSCGTPQKQPVGGSIPCSIKTLWIDKALEVVQPVGIGLLPVATQPLGHTSQQMRGQMRDFDPRQHQKAPVVGNGVDVFRPCLCRPTDKALARGQVRRCRTPCETGNRPIFGLDQVSQALTNRTGITEVMMGLEQGTKQRFVLSTSELAKFQAL